MNAIFIAIVSLSIIMICFVSPDSVIGIMLDGGTNAISLTLKMLAIYALWLSVLKMAEKTALDKKLANMFKPLTRRLFADENEKARNYISINLASNMLGMGSAATPAGIKAINEMYSGSAFATKNMIMFTVINATSVQLLPATVMSLIGASGGTSPSAIIIPSLIATSVSTFCGVVMVRLFAK